MLPLRIEKRLEGLEEMRMHRDIEVQLLQEIEALKQKIHVLEGTAETPIPTYQYSKIRDRDLHQLFEIDAYVLKCSLFCTTPCP